MPSRAKRQIRWYFHWLLSRYQVSDRIYKLFLASFRATNQSSWHFTESKMWMLEAHELHAHWPYALLIDWDKICLSVAIIAGNNDTIADPGVLYDHCHHHHHGQDRSLLSSKTSFNNLIVHLSMSSWVPVCRLMESMKGLTDSCESVMENNQRLKDRGQGLPTAKAKLCHKNIKWLGS